MKIPKSFIPEKDLDETIEALLLETKAEDNSDKETVSRLLRSCNIFTRQRSTIHTYLDEIYKLGERIADKMPYYTIDDLTGLSKRLDTKNCQDVYLGFYISALINKTATDNHIITLEPNIKLYGIGAYQQKGTTVLKGDSGSLTGHCLEGATLIIEGNTGNRTGNCMKIGRIVITGGSGEDTGDFMTGGEIITYGKIKSIAESCKGKIYSRGRKLR